MHTFSHAPRSYRIRPGHTFRQPDGTLLTGGDTIELDHDMAQQHAEKIESVTNPSTDASAGISGHEHQVDDPQ